MLKEYYSKGNIAFHLGLQQNGGKNSWNIIASFPKEVLQNNNDKIAAYTAVSQAASICKEEYLDGIAKIIIEDSTAHSFFYPQYIFVNSNMVMSEVLDFIFKNIKQGFVLNFGDFFSENFKPIHHFILRQKYFQIRRFYKAAAFKFRPCSKLEFESTLPSNEAGSQYVELISPTNHYCVFEDADDAYVLYFLLRHETPLMIVISERL